MGISSSVPSEETNEAMNRRIDKTIDDKNEQIRAEVKTLEQTVLKLQKNATETQEKLRTELMTEIGIQIEKLKPNPANSDAVKTLEQQLISLSQDVSRDKAANVTAVEKLGHNYDTLSRDVSQGKATVASLKSAVEEAMKEIATVRTQDAEHAKQLEDTTKRLRQNAGKIKRAEDHQTTLEKHISAVEHEVLSTEIKAAVNGEKIKQSKTVGETNSKKIDSIIQADKTLASTQDKHQTPAVGGTNASPDPKPPDDPKAVTKAVQPSPGHKARPGPKPDSMEEGGQIAGRLALSLLHAGLLQPVRNDVGTLGTTADLANPYLVRVV